MSELIELIQESNALGFKEEIHTILNEKIAKVLEDRKYAIAQTMLMPEVSSDEE